MACKLMPGSVRFLKLRTNKVFKTKGGGGGAGGGDLMRHDLRLRRVRVE